MKQLLKWATATYVCFAIFAAYSALAPTQDTTPVYVSDRVVMVEAGQTLLHSSQVDGPDQNGLVQRALDGFTIHYYGASWCEPCAKFKAKEIPALREAGAKVLVFDIDVDRPPRRIRAVPTLIIFKSGKLVSVIVGYKTCDEIVALLTE